MFAVAQEVRTIISIFQVYKSLICSWARDSSSEIYNKRYKDERVGERPRARSPLHPTLKHLVITLSWGGDRRWDRASFVLMIRGRNWASWSWSWSQIRWPLGPGFGVIFVRDFWRVIRPPSQDNRLWGLVGLERQTACDHHTVSESLLLPTNLTSGFSKMPWAVPVTKGCLENHSCLWQWLQVRS